MKRIFLLAVLATLMFSCGTSTQKETSNETIGVTSVQQLNNGVEVLYFHGKKRCVTCQAIESLSKEVTEQHFAEALANQTLVFHSIDFSKKANEDIVEKYKIAFSSLILVQHKDGKEEIVDLTQLGFTKAKNSPKEFQLKVTEKIEQLLADF